MELLDEKSAAKKYEVYKPKLKEVAILSLVSQSLLLFVILLFIFVPFFTIKVEVDGVVIAQINFSLFNEIKVVIDYLIEGGTDSIYFLYSIYQIFAVLMFIGGTGMTIYSVIKNIIAVINIDSYALETYDKIKRGKDDGEKKRWGRRNDFNSSYMFYWAITFEITYIILLRLLGFSGVGYMQECNGVSWTILFCILFLIPYLVVEVRKRIILKQVKNSILKEIYNVE